MKPCLLRHYPHRGRDWQLLQQQKHLRRRHRYMTGQSRFRRCFLETGSQTAYFLYRLRFQGLLGRRHLIRHYRQSGQFRGQLHFRLARHQLK